MKTQKTRDQVPVELTWNLNDLYPNPEEVYRDLEELREKAANLPTPDINSREEVLNFLKKYEAAAALFIKITTYAELYSSTDFTDRDAAVLASAVRYTGAKVQAKLTVAVVPLFDMDDELLEWWSEDPVYGAFFRDIRRKKPYRLSEGEEELLSSLGPILELPYEIYQGAKFVDLTFPDFTVDGKDYPLSFVLFENKYEYEEDTDIRRTAFDTFSKELAKYRQTMGTAFLGMVKRDLILSRRRGYDSVFDYLLRDQQIPKEVHHRHLDIIMEELPPVMKKYIGYLKEQYGLETMTYADLKIPPKLSKERSYTIPEARELILASLKPLGRKYTEYIARAFDERWVDFAENIGKSTGGFTSAAYRHHAYILMTWHGLLSDVFTLAHELGHAGQFYLTDRDQSVLVREPSLFFVEAPSTTSELLLTKYLLEQATTKEEERDILSLSLANTYYHNFVTHFLEGYFQREVYRKMEEGEVLTPMSLDMIMKETLEKFWGDAVELTPGAELTWMRQPHYYTGLYSYTYSAGLTLGTLMSKRLGEEPGLTKKWKEFLAMGGSRSPVESAKHLGIDISKRETVQEAISHIDGMIDQLTD